MARAATAETDELLNGGNNNFEALQKNNKKNKIKMPSFKVASVKAITSDSD